MCLTQEERIKTYKLFKEGSKRILVATDLVGRGIDIERVNIVINYDMPETDDMHGNGADTYLHRVRACVLARPSHCLLVRIGHEKGADSTRHKTEPQLGLPAASMVQLHGVAASSSESSQACVLHSSCCCGCWA